MGRILLLSMMMCVWGFQAQEPSNNCPVVENTVQVFCESQGEGNFYYRPAVQHLLASANGDEIAWYGEADSAEPLSGDELLVNGEDYFAGNATGDCAARVMVSVTLMDSPNAGATTHFEIANTAEPFDLLDVYNPSILGTPEAGGAVIPPLSSGSTLFDPAVDGSGQYRYVVESANEICSDDFSFIYITVVPDSQPPSGDPGEGQNCPTVDSVVQEFCASQGTGNDFYRPSVAHLVATANGDDIAWFDSPTSTEPLSFDEILLDGEDYYAGNASGDCTARVKVDCVVWDSPNAGSTTFMTFCSESGPVDLLDYMNPSILGEAHAGGQIVPPLNSGTTIFDPSIDIAGSYEYHVTSSNETCPNDKAVLFIELIDGVSAGEDISVTLSKIDPPKNLFTLLNIPGNVEASVSPSLASGTGMFDPIVDVAGEYTVTVHNEEGCEDDSAVVTVEIRNQSDEGQNCPIVEFTTQQFCESEGSGNNFYRPAVAHLSASVEGDAVVWYASEEATEPLATEELLIDGEDYFAGDASRTCMERPRVVVSLSESPNAGATTQITVNSTDAPFDLLDVYNPSILGAPDEGGTFDPPLASGTTIFDPSMDAAGTYTYTVRSTSDCPDDKSSCTITIIEEEETTAVASDANKVTMFPNPSKGNINISLSKGVSPVSLRIFDLSGNTVRTMELNSQLQLQNLDISGLRPSIYFAEVVTNQGKVVKRIIKN